MHLVEDYLALVIPILLVFCEFNCVSLLFSIDIILGGWTHLVLLPQRGTLEYLDNNSRVATMVCLIPIFSPLL